MFDADSHEFGRVAFDRGEFDAVTLDPFAIFFVGGYSDGMTVLLKPLKLKLLGRGIPCIVRCTVEHHLLIRSSNK